MNKHRKLLEYCFKNKSEITFFTSVIFCGIIFIDWKISHKYPNNRQWGVSFIGWAIIFFVNAIEEKNDEDDSLKIFKDPFLNDK